MHRRFSNTRFLATVWMIGLGFICLLPSGVIGASCSGGNCACGDTLTANYTMKGHFFCPAQNGIQIGAGVTLTCNLYSIRGTPTASNVGIRFAGHNGKAIGCHVSGFKVGITTNGFDGIEIRSMPSGTGGASHDNGDGTQGSYGIYITPGSCRYVIKGMSIYNNDDEGIHNEADCSDTTYGTIESNTMYGNTNEELSFLDADISALVTRNLIDGGTGTAVRLKNSSQNAFSNNSISGGTFNIDENSDLNYLEYNRIQNGTLRLRGVGTARPDGNDMIQWDLNGLGVVYHLDNPGINNICEDCGFTGGTPDGQCINFNVSPGTNHVIRPLPLIGSGRPILGTNDTGPVGNRCITVIP